MDNELSGILDGVWSDLGRGSRDAKSDFRKLWLGTVSEGEARVRMVILREVDRSERRLLIFTDPRTPKWEELVERPKAEVNFWSARKSVQLRCRCEAKLHLEGELWENFRQRLPEHSAGDYRAARVPGEILGEPSEGQELGEVWNFGVIELVVQEMDWLQLSREGHRRARFSWRESGWDMVWVQP